MKTNYYGIDWENANFLHFVASYEKRMFWTVATGNVNNRINKRHNMLRMVASERAHVKCERRNSKHA